MDTVFAQNATDRNLRAWLGAGPVDRSIGDGLAKCRNPAFDNAVSGRPSQPAAPRFGAAVRLRNDAQKLEISIGGFSLMTSDAALLLSPASVQVGTRPMRAASCQAKFSSILRPLIGSRMNS